PYIVFDDTPARGYSFKDYTAVPFERPPQGGHDPRVITPEAQYDLDQIVQDVPGDVLPPVFPTPLSVEKGDGQLVLEAEPSVSPPPERRAEADLAAEVLRPRIGKSATRAVTAASLRLEVGPVEGSGSPEAYELAVDTKDGIRIRGASPA